MSTRAARKATARKRTTAHKAPVSAPTEAGTDRVEQPLADVVPIRAGQPTGALAIRPDQTTWSTEQETALVAQFGLADAPRGDVLAFLHICQVNGLDPFRREAYLVGRLDRKAPSGKKWTVQTGIDGFRHIAERTGEYRGRVPTQWCGPDGEWKDMWLDAVNPPAAARVGVLRSTLDLPTFAVAAYHEFVPMVDEYDNVTNSKRRDADGKVIQKPQGQWGKMPAQMLAKVAEAQAIRAAFPRQIGGLYVAEEMHQADSQADDGGGVTDVRAQARRDARRAASAPAVPDVDQPDIIVVQGEVIHDAVVVEDVALDRDALLGEVAAQAATLGTTVAAMTRRWVAANRTNVADADDAAVAALVASMRPAVAERLRADGKPEVAAAYAASTEPAVDLVALLAGGVVVGERPGLGHAFLNDGNGVCVQCSCEVWEH